MEDCPVVCGESWLQEQLEVAIHRGNHASAQEPHVAKCLHDKALEKVQQGSARIVKWTDICNDPHPNLKISTTGCCPTQE